MIVLTIRRGFLKEPVSKGNPTTRPAIPYAKGRMEWGFFCKEDKAYSDSSSNKIEGWIECAFGVESLSLTGGQLGIYKKTHLDYCL